MQALNANATNPAGLRADKLNHDWLSGFVDGDGSIAFYSKSKYYRDKATQYFIRQLTQLKLIELLKLVHAKFGGKLHNGCTVILRWQNKIVLLEIILILLPRPRDQVAEVWPSYCTTCWAWGCPLTCWKRVTTCRWV